MLDVSDTGFCVVVISDTEMCEFGCFRSESESFYKFWMRVYVVFSVFHEDLWDFGCFRCGDM